MKPLLLDVHHEAERFASEAHLPGVGRTQEVTSRGVRGGGGVKTPTTEAFGAGHTRLHFRRSTFPATII